MASKPPSSATWTSAPLRSAEIIEHLLQRLADEKRPVNRDRAGWFPAPGGPAAIGSWPCRGPRHRARVRRRSRKNRSPSRHENALCTASKRHARGACTDSQRAWPVIWTWGMLCSSRRNSPAASRVWPPPMSTSRQRRQSQPCLEQAAGFPVTSAHRSGLRGR